jgi:mono/diheme cytochrome c family protein
MIAWTPERKRTLQITGIVLLVILALLGWFAWYKFFRVVPQPQFNSADERFMYGSIGSEETAGIPYWILYVLPRVFPDKMPGPAGYASFGLAWQLGKEWPVGFSKKTIGFDRVAQNCAVCHVASVRVSPMENPRFFPTGPNHTLNLEAFFRFLVDCGRDPRFNADAIMREIDLNSDLSWIDRLLYRFVYIPITRMQLLARGPRFQWIYFHEPPAYWPDWGRGRDDAMNLTKYFLTTSPVDDTLGPTDMPSIWNIGKYKAMEKFTGRENSTRLNFAGDSYDANSVIIDSDLGLYGRAPPNNKDFLDKKDWLYKYLSSYEAPKFRDVFPNVIDEKFEKKAEAGKAVFAAHCASCHWSDRTTGIPAPPRDQIRTGTVVPVGEVGTDIERIKSWNKDAAIHSNEVVKDFGIERKGLVEANPTGYIAAFLDGIWLRAPYLHNGSVPTLRDLLTPVDQRPQFFYRGYDVYDTVNGGFVSTEAQAQRLAPGWKMKSEDLKSEMKAMMAAATPYDVHKRSNGNKGHEYGVTLPEADKEALIEYLKTL